MRLSVVILTKNEQSSIKRCIKSVSFCDEVVVIDDYSTDKTVPMARQSKCRVFRKHLENDFASQRNFGLSKANGEWILFVDADEVVTPRLRDEILSVIVSGEFLGYYMKRRDTLWGKEIRHGEVGKTKFVRLAKKGSGKWVRKVHETWEVAGRVGNLGNVLIHLPKSSVNDYIVKIDRYSSLHADSNAEEGKTPNLTKIIFFPTAKFFQNYILKLGFLDGVQGFILACIMSLHSYLAWSKLWLAQVSKK